MFISCYHLSSCTHTAHYILTLYCFTRHGYIETITVSVHNPYYRLTLANAVQEFDLIIGNDQLLW